MALGYVFIGMIAGALGFLAAMLLGASLWSAILTYSLVGAVSMLILPLARFVLRNAPLATLPDLDIGKSVTPTAGQVAQIASDVAELALQPAAADMPMRILAVDDDPFILELVPKIAARVGCPDVTAVSSGAEAMDMIARSDRPFDCLLLDINMPGMDGIELCARIRETDGYDSASIIMLTAMTDIDYIERAFVAGATDYTSKPFDIIQFEERMRSAQAWTTVRRVEALGDGRVPAGDDPSRSRFRASRLLPGLVNVPLLLNEDALQNYLARLPSSAQASAYVMAIVLDEFAQPVDDLPSVELLTRLTRVAVAIDDVLKSDVYVMAYADEGRFVVASRALSLPAAHTMEAAIRDHLASEQMKTASERGDDLQISVGSAVRPGGRNAKRARMALDTAIHLAEARASRKTGAPSSVPEIRA